MEGINLKRLVDIVCYFNNINKKKFYSLSCKLNVVDCRIVVACILHNELNVSIDDISLNMSKGAATILDYLEDHKQQYGQINHYTKLYQNTLSQYLKHQNDKFSSDVEKMILKTNYDLELEKKIEKIINENTKLQHMLEREKLKNRYITKKNKNYV
jgi:hypothetical protein